MATPPSRRRLRWRRSPDFAALRLRALAVGVVPLALLAMAPTALARPAAVVPLAGLPSALPTVCVGGIVLCGGPVITQPTLPTPCVAGLVLCSPLPSILPSNPVIGSRSTPPVTPGRSPTPGRAPSPVAGAGPTPVAGPTGGGPTGGGLTSAALLPAPPGVGIVPPVQTTLDPGLAPDAFATILSLSMRDGLAAGGNHLWPWLLAAQLLLWTGLALVLGLRRPAGSHGARRP